MGRAREERREGKAANGWAGGVGGLREGREEEGEGDCGPGCREKKGEEGVASRAGPKGEKRKGKKRRQTNKKLLSLKYEIGIQRKTTKILMQRA
jgi:hypothetical protein